MGPVSNQAVALFQINSRYMAGSSRLKQICLWQVSTAVPMLKVIINPEGIISSVIRCFVLRCF